MFLEYGEYQRTNMIKDCCWRSKISGDTVLTFMVPQFWETSKVGALCNNGLLNQYMMCRWKLGRS
jgi:hypothetical protein